MKKISFLALGLLSLILLSACSTPEVLEDNTDTTTVADPEVCKEAIATYLENSSPEGSLEGDIAEAGDKVVVYYIGRFNDSEVFDTNIKEIAEACGRPYYPSLDEGLPFTVDAPGIIQGFSKGTKGLKVGETKTVEVLPSEGYGESDPTLIFTKPLSEVTDPDRLEVGMEVYLAGYKVRVIEKTKDTVTLDANHPMAGKTLTFDITLKELFPAE